MRTTLDIDDDVLQAAKELAQHEKRSAGAVLSELARRGLNGRSEPAADNPPRPWHGFVPFPSRGDGTIVTNEMIDRIREEEGI